MRWTLPPAKSAETVRTLYCFDGERCRSATRSVAAGHGAVVRADAPLELAAAVGAEVLVLQGRPIGEPVAQYGPFVMNDKAGIEQAMRDYRRPGFGGWPWPSDEPVHGTDPTRFAVRPDGVREDAPA